VDGRGLRRQAGIEMVEAEVAMGKGKKSSILTSVNESGEGETMLALPTYRPTTPTSPGAAPAPPPTASASCLAVDGGLDDAA